MEHTIPITFPEDETFDIGQDTRTGVALLEYRYDPPFKFNGKIDKLTFELKPFPPEQSAEAGSVGRPGPEAAHRKQERSNMRRTASGFPSRVPGRMRERRGRVDAMP